MDGKRKRYNDFSKYKKHKQDRQQEPQSNGSSQQSGAPNRAKPVVNNTHRHNGPSTSTTPRDQQAHHAGTPRSEQGKGFKQQRSGYAGAAGTDRKQKFNPQHQQQKQQQEQPTQNPAVIAGKKLKKHDGKLTLEDVLYYGGEKVIL
jgi:hypothetical protein